MVENVFLSYSKTQGSWKKSIFFSLAFETIRRGGSGALPSVCRTSQCMMTPVSSEVGGSLTASQAS